MSRRDESIRLQAMSRFNTFHVFRAAEVFRTNSDPADKAEPDTRKVARAVGIGLILIWAFLELATPGWTSRFASWPFVIGLFTLGMGHGATDFWRIRTAYRTSDMPRLLGWYFGLMITVLVLLLAVPQWTLVGFLILTAWHFGHEDSRFDQLLNNAGQLRRLGSERRSPGHCRISSEDSPGATSDPSHQPSGENKIWTTSSGIWHASEAVEENRRGMKRWTFARGALVIGIPLALHPTESGNFFRRIQQIVGDNPSTFIWEIGFAPWMLLLVVVASQVVAFAFSMRSHATQRRFVSRITDTGFLAFAAATIHPEFFVGAFLLFWHAPRHMLNLRAESVGVVQGDQPKQKQDREQHRLGIKRFLFDSAVFLLPTWAAIAVLWWWVGPSLPTPLSAFGTGSQWERSIAWLAAATVTAYVVVTLPHHLLKLGWADRLIRTDGRNRSLSTLREQVRQRRGTRQVLEQPVAHRTRAGS